MGYFGERGSRGAFLDSVGGIWRDATFLITWDFSGEEQAMYFVHGGLLYEACRTIRITFQCFYFTGKRERGREREKN